MPSFGRQLWDESLFDPMAFAPIHSELRLSYPLIGNWLQIIRDDFTTALAWAKLQNGYTGQTPDIARHLESIRVSDETETPVIALRVVSADCLEQENSPLVEVVVEFDNFLMVSGADPDDLSRAIDTYALALAELWFQSDEAQLFSGYAAGAVSVGGSTRQILGMGFGENVANDERIRKGQYRRTALLRMQTTFYCG